MIKKTTPLGSGLKFPTLELPRSGSYGSALALSGITAPHAYLIFNYVSIA